MFGLPKNPFRAPLEALLRPPPRPRSLTRRARRRRWRPAVEALEPRCVPAIVTYTDLSHLPLANGLLLDERTVFGSASYNANNGALSVQIDSSHTQGTVGLLNNFDFLYTPPTGGTGTDKFYWQVYQNGVSLIGQQEVDVTLSATQPPPGQGGVTITFQSYALNPLLNADAALFQPDDGSPLALPTITLKVQVQATSPGYVPTGPVEFTYTPSGGSETSLGQVNLGSDGTASVSVDSGLIAQTGVVVKAKYKGDPHFAALTANDGGNYAQTTLADPPVTDNPSIPPNATNLTVVVVHGANGAQTQQWWQSARAYPNYGAGAYIITTVHSVADLGAALAALPAGSVSHLVIGAHGWDTGPNLGSGRFNMDAVTAAGTTVQNQIKNALAANALIDLQSCGSASTPAGLTNMQNLANFFGVKVRGAAKCIGAWDDSSGNWVTKFPP